MARRDQVIAIILSSFFNLNLAVNSQLALAKNAQVTALLSRLEIMTGQASLLQDSDEISVLNSQLAAWSFSNANNLNMDKVTDLQIKSLLSCAKVSVPQRQSCFESVYTSVYPFLSSKNLKMVFENISGQVSGISDYQVYLCIEAQDKKCLLEYIKSNVRTDSPEKVDTTLAYNLFRSFLALGAKNTAKKYLEMMKEATRTLAGKDRAYAVLYLLQSTFLLGEPFEDKKILNDVVIQGGIRNSGLDGGMALFQLSGLNRIFNPGSSSLKLIADTAQLSSARPIERLWANVELAFSQGHASEQVKAQFNQFGSFIKMTPLRLAIDFLKTESESERKKMYLEAKSQYMSIPIYEYQFVIFEMGRILSGNQPKK